MEKVSCDVLCLGGGGAGVTAAISAARRGAKTVLVSKEPLGYGDTRASMGMVSCPGLVDGDSEEIFYHDIIRGGENLGNLELASMMAEKCREGCSMLENFGLLFQRDRQGCFGEKVVYPAGGHTYPRTLGCPPGGGVAIGSALRGAVARQQLQVFEEVAACALLTKEGRVVGATCYDLPSGETLVFSAGAVILASGGGGWLYYPHTDCSSGTTGDGFSLALRAGAGLQDMEQVQFIPFGLTHPRDRCGIFLGEPNIAAPAGLLRNSEGKVILEGLSRMTRAAVTRVMAEELAGGGGTEHGGLLLDLRPNLESEKGRRIWEVRRQRGQLNIVRQAYGEEAYHWKEPWDVAPTAHYFMGGVKIDTCGRSTVEGLLAAGQVAGGIHGGNRLGSVSLAELFVFGAAAGESAAAEAGKVRHGEDISISAGARQSIRELSELPGRKGRFSPLELQRRLQQVMWDKAGIARREKELQEALELIGYLEEDSADLTIPGYKVYNREVLHAVELRHMLLVAGMIVQAALLRKESRGAHYRLDFPLRDDRNWTRNIVQHMKNGEIETHTEAVRS